MQTSILPKATISSSNPSIQNSISQYRLQTFEQSIPLNTRGRQFYDHHPRDTREQALARAIRETG